VPLAPGDSAGTMHGRAWGELLDIPTLRTALWTKTTFPQGVHSSSTPFPTDNPHFIHKLSTMRFRIRTSILDQQLQHISRIVTTRQSVPVLSNVLIETDKEIVRLSGSDIDIAVTTYAPATILEEGAFTVPARVLQEFVHQNPDDELEIGLESYELVLHSQKVDGRIAGMDADEYPPLPEVKKGIRVVLPLQSFVSSVKQVAIACANDLARPALTGVSLQFVDDTVTLAATDSFRLVERSLPIIPMQESLSVVVPARTIQEITRVAGSVTGDPMLELEVDGQQLLARINEVEIYSRLLVGNFPKYQAIIPTTFQAEVEVTTAELVQALRLSYVFSQSGMSNVLLNLDEAGNITVQSYGSQKGSTRHQLSAVPQDGFTPLSVPFNAKYLLDACQAAGTPSITLQFSGTVSPLVLRTGEANYLQLVMPIRLDR
jgi:DNA polymerase III subunit beta